MGLQFQVGRDPSWLDRRDVCSNDLAVGKLVGKVTAERRVRKRHGYRIGTGSCRRNLHRPEPSPGTDIYRFLQRVLARNHHVYIGVLFCLNIP